MSGHDGLEKEKKQLYCIGKLSCKDTCKMLDNIEFGFPEQVLQMLTLAASRNIIFRIENIYEADI